MYQYAPARNAVFDDPAPPVQWKAQLGARMNGGLSLSGDTLFVEGLDKKLYALDRRTGAVRWTLPLSNVAMNAPLVQNGMVYAGTGSNHVMYDRIDAALLGVPAGDHVYAADARTGALRWRYTTPGEAMPTGLLTGGAMIFSAGDGNLRSLNAQTGALNWQARFPGYGTMGSLTQDGSLVIGASQMAAAFSLAAYRGGNKAAIRYQAWTWAVNPSTGQFVWIVPYGYGDCSPAVGGGRVFAERFAARFSHDTRGTEQIALAAIVDALDATSGRLLWEYRDPQYGPASGAGSLELAIAGMYSNETFYDSLSFSKHLAAFDARSGRLRWSTPTSAPVKMSAVEKDGIVYVGDTSGEFYAFDARTGAIRARIKFPGIFGTSPPVIAGSTLYVANGSAVYAIPLERVLSGLLPAPA